MAHTSKPWTSQPGGITLRYHRGRPLGQLLACVVPNAFDPRAKLLKPLEIRPIAGETTLNIPHYSWLVLRVNDAPGQLGDNTGRYEVTLTTKE